MDEELTEQNTEDQNANNPPAEVDLTAFNEAASQALAGPLQQIAARLDASDQALAAVTQQLQTMSTTPANGNAPSGQEDAYEAFEAFMKDPNGSLASVLKDLLDKQVMPGVNASAEAAHESHKDAQIAWLTENYGEEAWPLVEDIVNAGLGELKDPTARASKEAVKTIFRAAIGQDSVRSKLNEMEIEIRKNRSAPPKMLGKGNHVETDNTRLTEADAAYIESSGADSKEFLAIKKAGPRTVDEWKAAMKTIKEKK